jgi:hypothetical protein
MCPWALVGKDEGFRKGTAMLAKTTADNGTTQRSHPGAKVRAIAAVVVATISWVAVATSVWGHDQTEKVAWGADQCQEAALFTTTDYADVAPLVPAPFDDNVLKAGVPGAETATLIFTFNRCTNTSVVTRHGSFSTEEATEVIAGVMLSGSEYSGEVTQFYTLANYIDWEPLATAFKSIGLPTVHVPQLTLSFAVDALTHLGTITLDIPAPSEHVTAVGSMATFSPPPVDAHAASLGVGPRGVVVVHHHSPVFGVNPGATGTITTNRSDGMWAKAMGSTTRQVDGVFLEKGSGHEHAATLVA